MHEITEMPSKLSLLLYLCTCYDVYHIIFDLQKCCEFQLSETQNWAQHITH